MKNHETVLYTLCFTDSKIPLGFFWEVSLGLGVKTKQA